MLVIPLQATPSQSVNVLLANQACTINVYTRTTGLYCDLFVAGNLIIGGVLCLDAVRIVRDLYLGFVGDLAFFDMRGSNDPTFDGFGSGGRYFLGYLDTTDLGFAG